MDGSKSSIKAGSYAIDMAKKFNANLIVLHIVSRATYMDFGYANIGRMDGIKSAEKRKAQQVVDKVKKNAMVKKVKVKTDVILTVTSVVKGFVEYAEKHQINLIVAGSRGKTGFEKMLLGSVASGLVTYAHCPVLIVK